MRSRKTCFHTNLQELMYEVLVVILLLSCECFTFKKKEKGNSKLAKMF